MIRFSLADYPFMRLDDLQEALAAAEEAEDAAMVALASYGSRGGGDAAEFDALLKASAKARAATAAAYSAWRTGAGRVFTVETAASSTPASVRTNVYPFTRRGEIVPASPGATSVVLFASMGRAKAKNGEP
jgi:hypothetical protein